MRTTLALLATLLVSSACDRTSATTPAAAPNQVSIDVRCPASGVAVTVDPFQAHAARGQAMNFIVKEGANVAEVEIDSSTGPWPFDARPFHSRQGTPAVAMNRKADWPPPTGTHNVRYKIAGVCQSPGGQSYSFTLDPDMIVD